MKNQPNPAENDKKPAVTSPTATSSRQECPPFPRVGMVITFAEIAAAKTLEFELRAENERLKGLLEAGG
jgi:hypothetical protein